MRYRCNCKGYLNSGQLAGYAGDVWFPQPATKRPSMADNATSWYDTPYFWDFTLCTGTLCSWTGEILECWFEGRPIRDEYLIVDKGKLAGTGAHSYTAGNVTGGSEEAIKFKDKS